MHERNGKLWLKALGKLAVVKGRFVCLLTDGVGADTLRWWRRSGDETDCRL